MENTYTKRDGHTSTTGAPAGGFVEGSYGAAPGGSTRKRTMEIQLPLSEREDRAGGSYYIAAEVNIDQSINLGDYVILVLMGKKDATGHGPGPRIVLRPRDTDYVRESRDPAP